MKKRTQGFILVYTVLILSIMLIIGGIFADTVIKEVSISRDEAESLKAFYAADTGVECVRYFQNQVNAFDTTTAAQTYNCGVGADFRAGWEAAWGPLPTTCQSRTYTFDLTGFTNGACTRMTVNVIPRTIIVSGAPVTLCDIDVISNGRNSCAAGSKIVERTRWETI